MESLASGLAPSTDHNGNPFAVDSIDATLAGQPLAPEAGGANFWRGILLFVKGDLKFFAEKVGLAHWNSSQLCPSCYATRDDTALAWRNWAWAAAWRETVHTQEAFRARYSAEPAHPLLKWLRDNCAASWLWDPLHVVDYNGTAGQCYGNIFHSIVKGRELGAPQAPFFILECR